MAYTKQEALNLAVYYIDEARTLHEQEGVYGDRAAADREKEANAIELSKAFMMLHDRLSIPARAEDWRED